MFVDKDGYLKIAITTSLGTSNFIYHRKVWEWVNGPIPEGYTVDHIDGDKLNNHPSNLQLMLSVDNAVKGNAKTWIVVSPKGEEYLVYNLKSFCRLNGLNGSHMNEVSKRYKNQTQCKGWKCYEFN